MSIIKNILKTLEQEAPGLNLDAGRFPPKPVDGRICGKVIFAGGMVVSESDKPRNVMGGEVLRAEVFKVILRDENYIELERALTRVKNALREAGYIGLSGFEHLESKEDGLLQLAITFKSTKQN